MALPDWKDLHYRVVAAVDGDELSRHRAAERYGVAPGTAIRWMQSFRPTGNAAPGRTGGHKSRSLVGAHRIDFTLQGLKVDYRCIWPFARAQKLGFKKTLVAAGQDIVSYL